MLVFEQLPSFVRNSTILSAEEKALLCKVDQLPDALEVDSIRHLPFIQELTNAFIGDESTRDTHLQLKAKEYLEQGDVGMAWKVILLD